jgi:hypothetical protein
LGKWLRPVLTRDKTFYEDLLILSGEYNEQWRTNPLPNRIRWEWDKVAHDGKSFFSAFELEEHTQSSSGRSDAFVRDELTRRECLFR